MHSDEQIAAVKTAYRNQSNTYGHAAFVIEQRPVDNKTEEGWTPCPDYGDTFFAEIRVPHHSLTNEVIYIGLRCFKDGRFAAENVDYLKRGTYHCTYRIKRYTVPQPLADRIEASLTWKKREAQRMTDGTYTPLPWAEEPWFKARHAELMHFAHVSLDDPGKIAYTRGDEEGQRDIQTRVNAGRYLHTYFRHELESLPRRETGSVNVDGEKITVDALQWYARSFTNTYGGGDTLLFATTAEDMIRVYINGPQSCMYYPADHYESSVHPVTVYAAGDLALAYLENAQGEITARALVWPDKKAVGRLYGDDMALQAALDEIGYKKQDWYSLKGARLRVIEDEEAYVMPYIDGCNSYGRHPDGKHFQIGGACNAGRTDGLDRERNGCTCDRCGDGMDRDYSYTVYVSRYDDAEAWCQYCFETESYVDHYSSDSYSNRVSYYVLANGEQVARHNAGENYFRDAITNEWHHEDDAAGLFEETGNYVSVDAVHDEGLACDEDGTYWRPENMPPITNDNNSSTTTEEQASA